MSRSIPEEYPEGICVYNIDRSNYTEQEWKNILEIARIEAAKSDSLNLALQEVQFLEGPDGSIETDENGNRIIKNVFIQSGR